MSSITWLDYSEHERRKVLDVIDLFREKDTRDELGVGGVRDSFADAFFPGTSTIMTRARYFLIVPWIFRRLENRKTPGSEFAARARRAEVEVIESIEQSEDSHGNIGKVARGALKRMPSSVYWAGLGMWKIRTFRGALAQYARGIDRHYAFLDSHKKRSLEQEEIEGHGTNWHQGLISPPPEFPGSCSLALSRVEADYLRERILASCQGSLLAVLVAKPDWRCDVPQFVWEHPRMADFPGDVRSRLHHAQNFSESIHGVMLLYNLILAEQTHREELAEGLRSAFGEWVETMSARQEAFAAWNREEFWSMAEGGGRRITSGCRDFINTWLDLCRNGDLPSLRDDSAARDLVRMRERRLKRSLARIENPKAANLWSGDSGTGRLEFRWGISSAILEDIFEGLEEHA